MPANTYEFAYTVVGPTGVETVSSYALSNAPLCFKPVIDGTWSSNISQKRFLWDFGDGTTSQSITGEHVYTEPGEYVVKSYTYDELGEVYVNTLSSTIQIYDYIQDKIVLDVDKNTCNIEQNTGEIKNPINITQYNSARVAIRNKGPAPVQVYADSLNFDQEYGLFESNRINTTYGHLLPNHTFIQKINSAENLPISSIVADNYNYIYATLSGGEFISTRVPVDSTSVFAGVSSSNNVYFKSDLSGIYKLYFGFKQGSIDNYINTTTYGVSAKICENYDFDSLSITSNGIDGEDFEIDTFYINPVKFSNTEISFVVRVKDSENFSIKSLPILTTDGGGGGIDIQLTLTDGVSVFNTAVFESRFASMSSTLLPGFFDGYAGGFHKGSVCIDTDTVLEDVWIEASITLPLSVGDVALPVAVAGTVLSGASNTFTIYPKDYYVVAKQGEDVDFKDIFKDVAIQPLFTDTRMLMNDFIGSIFGDIESAQDTIGKSTYEKIENFFDNNIVIDYSNIDQLASILQSYDLPKINKYSLPPKIKRLVDLLSISQSRLFGAINQNRENFNSFGYISNDEYGIDRCAVIPRDGIVFAGFDIVAYERFSGKWTTLNTMLPLCASTSPQVQTWSDTPIEGFDLSTCFNDLTCTAIQTETLTALEIESQYFNICVEGTYGDTGIFSTDTQYYYLSDYNNTWGWPLTLDADGSLFDVYDFYYKTNYVKDDIESSVINFDDSNTTINTSYTHQEWSNPNGVMSHIFSNALYDGLDLFKG